MVLHDIEHFDDYLLAKLEQLERQQSPISAGHTFPRVDDSGGGTRSAPARTKQRRPRPLPNLLEKTLVARFRRVEVTPGGHGDARSGRGGLQGVSGGVLPEGGGRGLVRDAWTDGQVTEDGLSLLRGRTGSRNRKHRKAVSAPCERAGNDDGMDEPTAEERQRVTDAARVLRAVDTVKQTRKKWIMDRTLGVPRQFTFEKPHFKVVYDKSGQYRRKPSQITSMVTSASYEDVRSSRSIDDEKEDTKAKKATRPEIPGLYVFPKEENFIPREYRNVQEAGVDWTLNPSRSRAAPTTADLRPTPPGDLRPTPPGDRRPTPPGPAHGDFRRRCRVSYPVTEALHRAGTSTSKVKATTLRPGEMKVSKVWQGAADPCVPPAHQARGLRLELPPPRVVPAPIPSPYSIPFMNTAQLAN